MGYDFKSAGDNLQSLNSLINGSATGAAVNLRFYALAGIVVPASMAGTSITFEVSLDGVTYVPLKDDTGATITVTISSAAAFHSLRRILPLGCAWVKPVSSTSETNKTVTLIGQRVV